MTIKLNLPFIYDVISEVFSLQHLILQSNYSHHMKAVEQNVPKLSELEV